MISVEPRETTYRNPAKAMFFVVAGVFMAAFMVALLVLSEPDALDGVQLAVGLVVSVWSILRLSRCGVYADQDGIRVVNPLSSTQLRWDDVRRFGFAERGACRVEAIDGSSLKVFALQQSTWAMMRNARRTPEARMVAALNERLQGHRGLSG